MKMHGKFLAVLLPLAAAMVKPLDQVALKTFDLIAE